jgi:flagellar motor switch/type III secretory pathway protein FliN
VSSQGQISEEASGEVEPWNPHSIIQSLDVREARLANGFLRCHPERWFPGFAERWMSLISIMGCELQVLEIKPTLLLPEESWECFKGTIEGEGVLIAIEPHAASLIAEEVVPNVTSGLQSTLILDYLVQRCMAVLGMTQTVSETAGGMIFHGRCSVTDVAAVAAVRFSLSLNAAPCSVVVAMGQELVERMDRLWRRQVHSSARVSVDEGTLHFELAQLGVPPHLLSEYVSKGTVIDLEVPASDTITLRIGRKVFMPARLVDIDGMLGCQTIQGTAPILTVPEGTSRLSVEIASVSVDQNTLAELAQIGSVLSTGHPIASRVILSINQDRVAEARLSVYQGRYAVEVL